MRHQVQIGAAEKNSFAFTEQGVAMLSDRL